MPDEHKYFVLQEAKEQHYTIEFDVLYYVVDDFTYTDEK